MAIERRRTSQTWLLAAAALLATALAIGRDPVTRTGSAEGNSELAGDVRPPVFDFAIGDFQCCSGGDAWIEEEDDG